MHTPKVLLFTAAFLLFICRIAHGGIEGHLDGQPVFGMESTAGGQIRVKSLLPPASPSPNAPPSEPAKADEQPSDSAKADKQPSESAKTDEQPSEPAKADQQPSESAKADQQPSESAKADQQPSEPQQVKQPEQQQSEQQQQQPPPQQQQTLAPIQMFYQQSNSLLISHIHGDWIMIHPEQIGGSNAVMVGVSSVQPPPPQGQTNANNGNIDNSAPGEDVPEQPQQPIATNFANTYTHLQSGAGHLEEVSILPALLSNPAFVDALQQMLTQAIISPYSLRASGCGSKVHDMLGSIFTSYSAPVAMTIQIPVSVPNQLTNVSDQFAQMITQEANDITVNTQTTSGDAQAPTQTMQVTFVIINSYKASILGLPYYCRDPKENKWTRRDDDKDDKGPKTRRSWSFSSWPLISYFTGGSRGASESKQPPPSSSGKSGSHQDQLTAMIVFHNNVTGSQMTVSDLNIPKTLGELKIILDFDNEMNRALQQNSAEGLIDKASIYSYGGGNPAAAQPVAAY